jgi:K+-transporting ATPase KdpC subunit
VIGSALIGQLFQEDKYFHARPSATVKPDPNNSSKTVSEPYNAANSAGSNLGPTNKALIERVKEDVEKRKAENPNAPVPIDLVTTTASGLDPHISPEAALFQVARVAKARHLPQDRVRQLVSQHVEGRLLGFLGGAQGQRSRPQPSPGSRRWREGESVRLQVMDEGDGIPPDDLERIFDKFHRVQKGDQVRAGTGLGPSISRGFVEAMGGTIAAANRMDRTGAVFTIHLAGHAIRLSRTSNRMSAGALKILVVDDEPPIRKLLRMGLTSQGYEVLDAANGKMALELLAKEPDLVILDLGLSDVDGLELLRRSRHRDESLPVVVLSSRGDEAGKVTALDLGADDYVTKPFGMDELFARMRAALRHQLQVHGERPVFQVDELSVDLVRRIVKLGDKEVKL